MRTPFLVMLFLLATLCVAPRSAHAAESYDNCAHFIDAIPAVLDKQGVYCLRKDLSTAQTSGTAVNITANNVTIDCNDFKLGGLAAGVGSKSTGISAENNQNITIRHCNVRGFLTGIALGGDGHLIEDNLLQGNLYYGIDIEGDHNVVRRNRVFDTGGSTDEYYSRYPTGIGGNADIIDNVVDGVTSEAASEVTVIGISGSGIGIRIAGNRVGGLKLNGDGSVLGIRVWDGGTGTGVVIGNRVAAAAAGTGGYGIYDSLTTPVAHCADNTVANFAIPYENCQFVPGTYNASH